MPRKKILVTGAAGCVGLQLIRILEKKGYALRLTDRPGSGLPVPARNIEVAPADLTDPRQIPRLTRGISAVIHLAALVDISLTLDEIAPLNLTAVRNLYAAAARDGVRRFIFFSTGSLYAFKKGFVSEEDPANPLNDYGRSKLLGEDYLRSQNHRGPSVTIIRPALIFGPRGRVLLNMLAPIPALLSLFSRRAFRFAGGPVTNCVHSYDIANAAVFLMEHPQPHGEIFNVANDDPLDVGTMMNIILKEGGIRPVGPALPYPTWLMEWSNPVLSREASIGLLNSVIRRLWRRVKRKNGLKGELAPRVDPEMLDFFVHDMRFSNRKIKQLGFKLRYPDFASGWRETIRWMRREKWLP